MKKKITKLCILAIMIIAGVAAKAAGSSAYCSTFFDPTPSSNGTTDAFFITWETNSNGQVVITMDPFDTNPYALFRNFNLGSLKVNGAVSSTYFSVSYSGLTAVPAPTNQTYNKQVILTPISGVTIPGSATLVFNGPLEYMTANTSALNNLWPTVTFTYTYGTSCAGVPLVTPTPQSINFSPTQGVKTFNLTGVNLTGNLTLTASKGLSVSPTTIAAETDGTIASANQTVTVTWGSGATTGGYINISGGGLTTTKSVIVNSSGFSEFCNTVISQDDLGTTNMAYATVGTSADKTQVILSIAPYDPNAGATASWGGLGTILINGVTKTPTITYNSDNTVATLTFATALSNGDVVSFGNPLVWKLTGTLWNNGNCYMNKSKTYTVGLGCGIAQADNTPPVVVSANNVSTTSYNAVIGVNATDNIAVTNIHFVDATNGINVTQAAKSDNGTANYTISNLQGNIAYSFVVTALDLAGNETAVGNAKTVAFTTLPTPQITAIPNSLDFTPTTGSKTFTLSGAYVTDVIQLSVPAGYTVTPSTLTPTAGTIAATTVTVNWMNGLGNKIGVSGGGLQNSLDLVDLTYSGGFSDYCSYVITQGGGASLTTPALLNIGLNTDNTVLTYKIAPFDITGDATWNGNSLGANSILLNGNLATPTRTQVDSHTITLTFSQPLVIGDVISYGTGTTLVWTTTGYTNYGNNGNCYIDGWSKTYTIGQSCNVTSYNVTTNTNVSNLSCLNCDVIVNSGVLLNIDESKTFKNITVAPGGKITNSTGQTLTATSLNLNSDASGTATYVDNGTSTITTANVQQYLTVGRNWYVSSPVSGATSNVFNVEAASNINQLYSYDETKGNTSSNWPQITSNATSLLTGRGYVANVDASLLTTTNGVTFTGGSLNTGDFTTGVNGVPELTSTSGIGQYQGYNLIGNPYPSYLNAMMAINNANTAAGSTVIDPTIWYRTQAADAYYFETVNTTSGIGTNCAGTGKVTGYIPPMQAFWVHVATTPASLTFSNNMRAHAFNVPVGAGTVPTTPLKAPSAQNTAQQVLRLQVSNGTNSDEAIIYVNPNASNGFDNYDSQKRSNANAAIPEIYTAVGNEKLVINGLNSIMPDTEIPLGFTTGQSNAFTIKATEISNFDADAQIILKDNLLNTEQDLTANATYSFASDVTSTSSRFSLVFKSPAATTGLIHGKSDNSILIYKNPNNQIAIQCSGNLSNKSAVVVSNTIGQKLVSKQLTSTVTVIDSYLRSGVYLVTVTNAGKTITQKVILN